MTTADEWDRCLDPGRLGLTLSGPLWTGEPGAPGRASARRLRLVVAEAVRAFWAHLTPAGRAAVEAAERHADDIAWPGLERYRRAALRAVQRLDPPGRRTGSGRALRVGGTTARAQLAGVAARAADPRDLADFDNDPTWVDVLWKLRELGPELGLGSAEEVDARHARLIRDVFPNPFRPVALEHLWRTCDATALARGMYESRDFSAMPILADALRDAGCDHPDILDHCHGSGPHARGCWVVDLVLGRE